MRVEPRIVHAGDERRLTGYAALPFNLNPYLRTFGDLVLAAGHDPARRRRLRRRLRQPVGRARRRVHVPLLDQRRDAAPRRAAHAQREGGRPPRRRASDAGSGVDPASVVVRIDGEERRASFAAGEVRIATRGLRKGRHTLRLQISDYQESRNMENVGRILPNTRILQTTFTVR